LCLPCRIGFIDYEVNHETREKKTTKKRKTNEGNGERKKIAALAATVVVLHFCFSCYSDAPPQELLAIYRLALLESSFLLEKALPC
jgi:hypothetical protein